MFARFQNLQNPFTLDLFFQPLKRLIDRFIFTDMYFWQVKNTPFPSNMSPAGAPAGDLARKERLLYAKPA